jgi:nucleotide-binding universal stress UspA family protein
VAVYFVAKRDCLLKYTLLDAVIRAAAHSDVRGRRTSRLYKKHLYDAQYVRGIAGRVQGNPGRGQMLNIGKILFPVDFSERCLAIVPYVRAIAKRYKAEVILFHVLNPVYAIPAAGIAAPALMPAPQWVFTEKTNELEKFAASELRDHPVRRLVYEGDPEVQIVDFARAESVQLTVIPTHGYGVLRRYLIGSVAAKVLDDVACPVLTGAHMASETLKPNLKFANVVCAVDLGPQSQNTLVWASQLANDFDARLSIVHVIPAIGHGLSTDFSSRLKQKWENMAREEIEKLRREGIVETVSVFIQEGDVAHAVSSFAHSIAADLVIIGRGAHDHGTGRLRTNAYAIIRQALCPVLSV